MKKVVAVFLISMLLLSLCGCSESESTDGQSSRISIATATSGGTLYYIGAAQSQILNSHIDEVDFSVESTDGSFTTNGPLVQNNSDCLGIIVLNAMQESLTGEYDELPGTVLDKLRLIMTGHATKLMFVTLEETGIKSLEDLKGKRIATASPGSVARAATLQILNEMGYEESDFAALTAMTVTDMADALKDGSVDVAVFNGGSPTAAISDLNSTRDIVMLQVPQDILEKIVQEHPGYDTYVVTNEEYSDLTQDCTVLGLPMGIACNADMDEELVYEITKVLNEGTDELAAAHTEGANWNTENTLAFYNEGTIPFHPGAARYYDEIQGE